MGVFAGLMAVVGLWAAQDVSAAHNSTRRTVAASTDAPAVESPTAGGASTNGDYLAGALREVQAGDAPSAAAPSEKPGAVIGRVVLDLAVVCVLLVAFLFVLRWILKRGSSGTPVGGLVRVVDVAHIAPKKSVYLLEVVDRILVVGSAGDQMTLLSEIRDKETVERLRQHGELSEGFLAALSNVARRIPRPGSGSEER